MPITLEWFDDQKTIIHYRYRGNWTWPQYHAMFDQSNEWYASVPHRVDAILDLSVNHGFPPGAIGQLKRATATNTSNWGITVVIGGDLFVKALYGTMQMLYPRHPVVSRYLLGSSIEHALQLIAESRATDAVRLGS